MAEGFLSQDEADALLKGLQGEQDDLNPENEAASIRNYNLATQERIVRGRMPTLEIINERFARLFRIGLFNLLRRTAEVSVGPLRTCKYSEFVRNLVVPTNLNLVQLVIYIKKIIMDMKMKRKIMANYSIYPLKISSI